MAEHQDLAGGLIGGAGALFAAFIAADAVWQQILDVRRQVNVADGRRNALELFSFGRVIEYYTRLLRPFEEAGGFEDIKYVNGMNMLFKTGDLVPFFGSLPPDHQSLARDAWERTSNLNHALGEVQIGMSGAPDVKSRTEINRNISDLVGNMREYRDLAKAEFDSRKFAARTSTTGGTEPRSSAT
jgi:hypothetical protein